MKRVIFFTVVSILIFTSCASKKDFAYLQYIDSITIDQLYMNSSPKLQTGDILTISVVADDVRATQPFNPISSYASTGVVQDNNPFIPTYTIDRNGYIDFPKLGKIKLGGMTRIDAMELLKEEVGKYVVNPGINIDLRNFKISVLGEVKNPGTFSINNDRVSLFEALGLAGDLTINGVRKNVLIIREEGGLKNEYRVDLTSRETLNSPVYYLRQNDVVYVEPNKAKIQSSKYTQNTTVFVSIASLIITTISILTR